MQEVNIYIATTARGPRVNRHAYYSYILECELNGKTVRRDGTGKLKDATENQSELTAIIAAFKRLTKPCSVRVFTQCEHILNSVNNGWVYQWKKNNWIKSGNRPVKNALLWQQLINLSTEHVVKFTKDTGKYFAEQEQILNRMQEADNG